MGSSRPACFGWALVAAQKLLERSACASAHPTPGFHGRRILTGAHDGAPHAAAPSPLPAERPRPQVKLDVGANMAELPEWSQPLQPGEGTPVRLSDYVGHKSVILFFFPRVRPWPAPRAPKDF